MSQYGFFVEYLRVTFCAYLSSYVAKRHEKQVTKIKRDGTPQGDLDNFILDVLREAIHRYFPEDFIFGEEDELNDKQITEILNNQDVFQWTVDGLDGTGNFLLGANSFGAMISRRQGDKILFVAAFRPIDEQLRRDGFYYAELGQGAFQWCGDHGIFERLHTAKAGLDRITVLLEGSSKKFGHPPISELMKHLTTRSSLSCCVAATAVAQGKASSLVTIDNKPWDNWPAILLIKEAGGIVTDWQGNPVLPHDCANIVAAANAEDWQKILNFLI